MLVQLSGPAMALEPGDEREFPQDEAVRLIKAGYAAPVVTHEVERAVLPPPAETRFAGVLKLPDTASRERGHKRNRR